MCLNCKTSRIISWDRVIALLLVKSCQSATSVTACHDKHWHSGVRNVTEGCVYSSVSIVKLFGNNNSSVWNQYHNIYRTLLSKKIQSLTQKLDIIIFFTSYNTMAIKLHSWRIRVPCKIPSYQTTTTIYCISICNRSTFM